MWALNRAFEQGFGIKPSDHETFLRWLNASKNGLALEKVLHLQWTDIYASLVTGTKSRLGTFTPGTPREYISNAKPTGEVFTRRNKVTYEYKFATPAIVCCFIWVVWAVICLYMSIAPRYKGRISLSGLSTMINRLSVGRSLVHTTDFTKQTGTLGNNAELTTKEWVREAGKTMVNMSKWPPELLDGQTGLRARKGVSDPVGGEEQGIKA